MKTWKPLLVACALGLCTAAWSQAYPTARPVRILVPAGTGSATDVLARMVRGPVLADHVSLLMKLTASRGVPLGPKNAIQPTTSPNSGKPSSVALRLRSQAGFAPGPG